MSPVQLSLIIPVYSQWEMTECLLRSIETTLPYEREKQALHEILLVNDNPNDTVTDEALQLFCQRSSLPLQLVRNQDNLGFVRSVNRGLSLAASDSDIVIVNSDTEVFAGWLDEFVDTIAYFRETGISWASLTPVSNAATIASVPKMGTEWSIDADTLEPRLLARLCLEIFSGNRDYLELPTGVGFFMAMNRQVLAAVGHFSLEFSPGYGEETDWCIRAQSQGFKSFLSPSIFVAHKGGASFGVEKQKLLKRGGAKMRAKHPSYDSSIAAFIAADVNHRHHKLLDSLLAPLRDFKTDIITIHLCNRNPFRNVGGLEKYISEITSCLATLNSTSCLISPVVGSDLYELVIGSGNPVTLSYSSLLWLIQFFHKIRSLEIASINIQHLHGWDHERVLSLIDALSPAAGRVNYIVHDYSAICTDHNLLWKRRSFCSAPSDTGGEWCNSCPAGVTVESHRSKMREVIQRATATVYSSPVAQEWLEKIFPESAGRAEFCPIIEAAASSYKPPFVHPKIALLFIGATGPHKGILEFEKLAVYFAARFRFLTIGVEDFFGGRLGVEHRHYNHMDGNNIKSILQGEFPAFSFLGSITPETFSFTAYECLEAGIPILTTAQSGNICRIVHQHQAGLEFRSLAALATYLDSETDVALRNTITRLSSEHLLTINERAIGRIYLDNTLKSEQGTDQMRVVPHLVSTSLQ